MKIQKSNDSKVRELTAVYGKSKKKETNKIKINKKRKNIISN